MQWITALPIKSLIVGVNKIPALNERKVSIQRDCKSLTFIDRHNWKHVTKRFKHGFNPLIDISSVKTIHVYVYILFFIVWYEHH